MLFELEAEALDWAEGEMGTGGGFILLPCRRHLVPNA
jgi:hypothetical protein